MALKFLKPHVFLASQTPNDFTLNCMVPLQNNFTNNNVVESIISVGADKIKVVSIDFLGQGSPNEQIHNLNHPITLNVAEPENLLEVVVLKEGVEQGKIRLDFSLAYNGQSNNHPPCGFLSKLGGIEYEFSCLINLPNGHSSDGFVQHYLPNQNNDIKVNYHIDGSTNNFPIQFDGIVQIDDNYTFLIETPPNSSRLVIRQLDVF